MENSKSKFRLYIENLWYHEKAKIIIFGVVIIFLIVCISQCSVKKNADVYMLYAGAETVTRTTVNDIQSKMPNFIPEDYNKDGAKEASFIQFQFESGAKEEEQKQFDSEMFGGKAVILFLSPKDYKYCRKNNYIVPLKDVLGELPEIANDDYSINLFDLECATEMGVNMLPMDTVVCIAARRESDSKTEYNNQVKFFEYMITYGM